jgi:hypothetical protein
LTPINKVRIRDGKRLDALLGRCLVQNDKAVSILVRQRAQENSIYKTEESRVGADAEGQCDHGNRREARPLKKGADPISNVFK